MNHDQLTGLAGDLLGEARTLGFDRLDIAANSHTLFGVRIANNVVCRENILRRNQELSLTGYLGRRIGHAVLNPEDIAGAKARLRDFFAELSAQPESEEFSAPQPPKGEHSYRLNEQGVLSSYGPEVIYPAIAKQVEVIRSQGLRLTGYAEALACRTTIFSTADFSLDIDDHAITFGATVDRPQTGAISSAQESATGIGPGETQDLIQRVCAQATQIALLNHDSSSLDPQDLTVVLSPRAVADILTTPLMYRMFDRRKVDEGRTYLSNHRDMEFPAGLSLGHYQQLNDHNHHYQDPGFNSRLVPCQDMHIIRQGKLQDLHTDGYWADRSGHPESYDPYFAAPVQLNIDPATWQGELCDDTNALIAATEYGVYVHNTWYLRMVSEMNGTITGMTRDGVFLIEDGKLTRPLFNLRWHENPFRILAEADGASRERCLTGLSRWAGRSRRGFMTTPALRVPRFHFSSSTDF